MRGELIDIGGRRLRAVRAGPAESGALAVLECGSFGCAADWAVVQSRLASIGVASLAYDRAGLGYSDPGPAPRDGAAIAADLETLLARMGEARPLVAVGHSMAGLFLRIFAPRNRERLLGLVLVDAVAPELGERRRSAAAIQAYRAAMRVVRRSAGLGYMRPVSSVIGDLIGLEGEASLEKRRIYGSATHARWAADEVVAWPATSAQGLAAGAFDPDLPVAVVTAGDAPSALKALQEAPALASRAGRVEHVAGANHASLLGRRFADPVVAGVRYVLEAAGDYVSRSKIPQVASSRS